MNNPTRPLTDDERLVITALHFVRFPTASWEKRFFRNCLIHAEETNAISDKAAAQLWRIFIRYRRQTHKQTILHKGSPTTLAGAIWQSLMDSATKLAAPDFRKQQAAAREQAKIDALKSKYESAMNPPASAPTDAVAPAAGTSLSPKP